MLSEHRGHGKDLAVGAPMLWVGIPAPPERRRLRGAPGSLVPTSFTPYSTHVLFGHILRKDISLALVISLLFICWVQGCVSVPTI